MRRSTAVWIISGLVFLLSIPSAVSMGLMPDLMINNMPVFDFVDFVASNWFLPLSGLVVTLFAGYFWKNVGEEAGLTQKWFRIWLFMLRYIAPILVLFVFLYSAQIIKL